MAKAKSRKGHENEVVILIQMKPSGAEVVSVTFGGVQVQADRVKPTTFKRNVRSGQLALQRAADQISEVGVDIRKKPGVPTYRVDPKNIGRVIRQLGRKTESGVFEDGAFKVLP